MFDELNDRLLDILERRKTAGSLKKRLASVEAELAAQRERLAGLRVRMALESADVKALEGLSLTALFHAVLGDKKERIKKEQKEFLSAKLKHDECEGGVRALEKRVAELRGEYESLGDYEGDYEQVLREKERALASSGGAEAAELGALTQQLAQERLAIRELKEALNVGEAARRALVETANSLSSAGTWGVFDIMGGGLLTTALKHSQFDDARRTAHHAQQLLRRFQAELADARNTLNLELDMQVGGFATFADYFFDGLIADWIVQSKIGESSEEVGRVLSSLRASLEQLQSALATKERDADRIESARRQVIEAA